MPDARDLIGIIEDSADLPVLLEIDNYVCQTANACICSGGYDEITGFAQKAPQQRRDFLKQYYHEVRSWPNIWCSNRVYLCLPGRRGTCMPGCTGARPTAGALPYPGNNYSPYREHCGDEDTIAGLFQGRIKPRPAAAPKRDLKPAPPPAPPAAPTAQSMRETFDLYHDGPLAGQGGWVKSERSAGVQSAFIAGKSGKAIELAPDRAGGTLNDKLTLPTIQGGVCTLSFDIAYKGDPKTNPTDTYTRIDFFSAAPDAESRPGGMVALLYWGASSRIVYQGDQSKTVVEAPASGRWYRLALKFDLDALTVDVSADGKPVAAKLPLRDCQAHSLGRLTMTTWAMGSNIRVYLDNLTVEPEPFTK